MAIYDLAFSHTGKEDRQSRVPLCARSGFASEKNSADFSKSCFGGHSEAEGIKMRRSEKVEATLTAEEKEILQRLCGEAGCTDKAGVFFFGELIWISWQGGWR